MKPYVTERIGPKQTDARRPSVVPRPRASGSSPMDGRVFLIDHGGVKLYPDAPSTSEGSREYEHGVGQIQH
jgi:hypothetical protein